MTSTARLLLRRHRTADPELVAALSELLVTVTSPRVSAAAASRLRRSRL